MPKASTQYFLFSVIVHILVLLVLLLGFDQASTPPVFENTNQHDIVSAVVLGDIAKSKILPKPAPPAKILPPSKNEAKHTVQKPLTLRDLTPQPTEKPLPNQQDNNVIALKKPDHKKKLAEENLLETIKRKDLIGKDLLADIKKQTNKQKKLEQKRLRAQFQKILREQSEQSLRQQLLDEEIKLQGTQTRQSQGEINKYKALILQAISEQWLVPNQADRQLSCELMIRVAPGGMVLDVRIIKTSGDPSLDNSARAAVLKASPLPVPSNAQVFAPFRQFMLKVKPENILRAGGEQPGGLT
jgi:colicin import membrane protein